MPHGTQKCHKGHFLAYEEGWLGWVLGGNFCLLHLDVFTEC